MERPFPTSGINGLAGRMEKKLTVLPVVEQNLNDYLFIRYIVCTFYYFRHLIFFA